MGNHSSKKLGKKKGKGNIRKVQSALDFTMDSENDGGTMSQKKFDEEEVYKLKRELMETPQIFVLNNLLMSIVFFENYEKEKQRLMHSSRTTREKELNPTLLRDETIECVIPDGIFEVVNKNVKFRRLHGPNKNKIEPLVPRRLYVVNDNIEVIESKHAPHYSAIDKPSYQVIVEDSPHSGFVKLKCAPSQVRQISNNDVELKPEEPTPGTSSQSDDSDVYEYSTITKINTPKPLNITSWERRDTLPKSCFSTRKIRKFDENSSDESDEEDEDEEPHDKEELYEVVSYISSSGFMTHFQNAVFPNSLGRALGFDMSEIGLAKAIPGKIFCNLQDVDEEFSSLPCVITPSVAIQWPIDLTFEFHERSERPTMWNKYQTIEYRWPQDRMIQDIRGLSCVLIPRGYILKKGENADSEIEWEVGFPKAERYLDNHMNHTQLRAFLFLLTIYKTYIEPATKYYGLLADHIRTHMYWEVESNPRDWPEHRLGSKMVLVIKNLIKKLAGSHLSDFFIKRKNIFANVPNKHLQHAQRIFHNVLETPALYFIGALRNLRYNNPKFYPYLDFKKLYTTLTSENPINSALLDMRPPNVRPKNRRPPVQGSANERQEIKWRMKRERLNRERVLREKKEQKEREENLRNERRGSIDSIDFEWQCERRFDMFKTREILIFFIKHFIEMAKKSRRLATQRQALLYLKQSYYLSKILEEIGLEADAQELLETITKEEDTSKKLSVTESFELPPSTPKRHSAQFNWELTQQVSGNNINLNNLNKSYNSTSVTPSNFIRLKKHPSNLKGRNGIIKSSFSNEDRRQSLEGATRRSVSVGFSDTIEVR